MNTFTFRTVLKDHNDGPEAIASKLYVIYDDVTVSSFDKIVCVTFVRKSTSFSVAIRSAYEQLAMAGYSIDRVEIDGQELPLADFDEPECLDDTKDA